MEIVLRVFQVFLAIGLIAVVLLQRSEGGGLGIGSSGGAGSFMSVRGTANFLTRVTAILAFLFMTTCLTLALLAKPAAAPKSIFDSSAPGATIPAPPVSTPPASTLPVNPPPVANAPAAAAPAAAPASEQLPVPVPGEGVTTTPPLAVSPPIAPAPSMPTPTATAPQTKVEAPAAKAKAKKAPPAGAAHTTGQ